MNTEIYIENFRLDVSSEISALLNFALADIKDFSARSTTWSKTIVLPGTANNNQLFGHIFQIGQANFYDPAQDNVGYNFNASKAADCVIFQDQLQTFKGVLRLLQINIYKGRIDYEVSVFGKLSGLNSALSSGLIEDLDFSEYDHVYNDGNIVASWDNPGGSGVYYPLIDYGTYSPKNDKHNWDIQTFRPALYVREYIDKMFEAANFRYSCDLFDTERFRKLIVPFNRKVLTIATTELAKITKTTPQGYTLPQIDYPYEGGTLLNFDTIEGNGFTANSDKTVFTYNGTISTNVPFHLIISGTFNQDPPRSIRFWIWKNGVGGTLIEGHILYGSPYLIDKTYNLNVAPGDTIEVRMFQVGLGGLTGFIVNNAEMNFTSQGTAGIPVPIAIGDTVTINDNLPKNTRQIDFMVGIVKLFNLYVYEDRFDPNLMHIRPYINFYSTNQNESVDWTYKLDRDQAIKVKPMSELTAKVYNFKFKPDNDYFNELYRKRYNEGYGDRVYDSQFEFAEQVKEFEIIFSSTVLVGYAGEIKVYPTIFKQSNDVEETVDCNIRILQSKRITDVPSWQIKNGDTVLNTLTRYGYAGHLNDPDAPSDDLNFGVTRELFFELATGNLSDNQFNVYWSGYMAEITDKDSKLLTGKFYLTPADIAKLDFSKYIYLDGVLFRLNSIKDYNASKPSTCTVELLKVNELNFTEASPPEGPPEGNFLLWSNDNIMYFDDVEEGNELLWRDDQTSGLNYDMNGVNISITTKQTLRIFINTVEVVSTGPFGNGSLTIKTGDIVQATVSALWLGLLKKTLVVSSDVDGTLYDSDSDFPFANKTFTWTVEDGRVYTIDADITIE